MRQQAVTDGTLQPITAAGPAGPTTGFPIAALSGDYELSIEITAFSCTSGAAHCRITAEDTVNAFTAAVPIAEWTFQINGPGGSITPAASVKASKKATDAPGLRIGTTSAALRFNVVEIDGTGASLTFGGYLWN